MPEDGCWRSDAGTRMPDDGCRSDQHDIARLAILRLEEAPGGRLCPRQVWNCHCSGLANLKFFRKLQLTQKRGVYAESCSLFRKLEFIQKVGVYTESGSLFRKLKFIMKVRIYLESYSLFIKLEFIRKVLYIDQHCGHEATVFPTAVSVEMVFRWI